MDIGLNLNTTLFLDTEIKRKCSDVISSLQRIRNRSELLTLSLIQGPPGVGKSSFLLWLSGVPFSKSDIDDLYYPEDSINHEYKQFWKVSQEGTVNDIQYYEPHYSNTMLIDFPKTKNNVIDNIANDVSNACLLNSLNSFMAQQVVEVVSYYLISCGTDLELLIEDIEKYISLFGVNDNCDGIRKLIQQTVFVISKISSDFTYQNLLIYLRGVHEDMSKNDVNGSILYFMSMLVAKLDRFINFNDQCSFCLFFIENSCSFDRFNYTYLSANEFSFQINPSLKSSSRLKLAINEIDMTSFSLQKLKSYSLLTSFEYLPEVRQSLITWNQNIEVYIENQAMILKDRFRELLKDFGFQDSSNTINTLQDIYKIVLSYSSEQVIFSFFNDKLETYLKEVFISYYTQILKEDTSERIGNLLYTSQDIQLLSKCLLDIGWIKMKDFVFIEMELFENEAMAIIDKHFVSLKVTSTIMHPLEKVSTDLKYFKNLSEEFEFTNTKKLSRRRRKPTLVEYYRKQLKSWEKSIIASLMNTQKEVILFIDNIQYSSIKNLNIVLSNKNEKVVVVESLNILNYASQNKYFLKIINESNTRLLDNPQFDSSYCLKYLNDCIFRLSKDIEYEINYETKLLLRSFDRNLRDRYDLQDRQLTTFMNVFDQLQYHSLKNPRFEVEKTITRSKDFFIDQIFNLQFSEVELLLRFVRYKWINLTVLKKAIKDTLSKILKTLDGYLDLIVAWCQRKSRRSVVECIDPFIILCDQFSKDDFLDEAELLQEIKNKRNLCITKFQNHLHTLESKFTKEIELGELWFELCRSSLLLDVKHSFSLSVDFQKPLEYLKQNLFRKLKDMNIREFAFSLFHFKFEIQNEFVSYIFEEILSKFRTKLYDDSTLDLPLSFFQNLEKIIVNSTHLRDLYPDVVIVLNNKLEDIAHNRNRTSDLYHYSRSETAGNSLYITSEDEGIWKPVLKDMKPVYETLANDTPNTTIESEEDSFDTGKIFRKIC